MNRLTTNDLASIITDCREAGIKHLDVVMTVKGVIDSGSKLSDAAIEAHFYSLQGRLLRGVRA